MISFAFVLFAIVGVGAVLLTRILPEFQPGYNKIKADLKEMQQEMDGWLKESLVPIGREELELFSLNQLNQTIKKRATLRAKGIFTTIYNEPILAYSYKKYVSSKGINALLYARTAHHHYAYWVKGKEIQILIDNKLTGVLLENGVLYDERKRALAAINRNQAEVAPVLVNNREVASVVKTELSKGQSLSPRAFQFVKPDMNEEEEKLFLALATLELVQRSVPKK